MKISLRAILKILCGTFVGQSCTNEHELKLIALATSPVQTGTLSTSRRSKFSYSLEDGTHIYIGRYDLNGAQYATIAVYNKARCSHSVCPLEQVTEITKRFSQAIVLEDIQSLQPGGAIFCSTPNHLIQIIYEITKKAGLNSTLGNGCINIDLCNIVLSIFISKDLGEWDTSVSIFGSSDIELDEGQLTVFKGALRAVSAYHNVLANASFKARLLIERIKDNSELRYPAPTLDEDLEFDIDDTYTATRSQGNIKFLKAEQVLDLSELRIEEYDRLVSLYVQKSLKLCNFALIPAENEVRYIRIVHTTDNDHKAVLLLQKTDDSVIFEITIIESKDLVKAINERDYRPQYIIAQDQIKKDDPCTKLINPFSVTKNFLLAESGSVKKGFVQTRKGPLPGLSAILPIIKEINESTFPKVIHVGLKITYWALDAILNELQDKHVKSLQRKWAQAKTGESFLHKLLASFGAQTSPTETPEAIGVRAEIALKNLILEIMSKFLQVSETHKEQVILDRMRELSFNDLLELCEICNQGLEAGDNNFQNIEETILQEVHQGVPNDVQTLQKQFKAEKCMYHIDRSAQWKLIIPDKLQAGLLFCESDEKAFLCLFENQMPDNMDTIEETLQNRITEQIKQIQANPKPLIKDLIPIENHWESEITQFSDRKGSIWLFLDTPEYAIMISHIAQNHVIFYKESPYGDLTICGDRKEFKAIMQVISKSTSEDLDLIERLLNSKVKPVQPENTRLAAVSAIVSIFGSVSFDSLEKTAEPEKQAEVDYIFNRITGIANEQGLPTATSINDMITKLNNSDTSQNPLQTQISKNLVLNLKDLLNLKNALTMSPFSKQAIEAQLKFTSLGVTDIPFASKTDIQKGIILERAMKAIDQVSKMSFQEILNFVKGKLLAQVTSGRIGLGFNSSTDILAQIITDIYNELCPNISSSNQEIDIYKISSFSIEIADRICQMFTLDSIKGVVDFINVLSPEKEIAITTLTLQKMEEVQVSPKELLALFIESSKLAITIIDEKELKQLIDGQDLDQLCQTVEQKILRVITKEQLDIFKKDYIKTYNEENKIAKVQQLLTLYTALTSKAPNFALEESLNSEAILRAIHKLREDKTFTEGQIQILEACSSITMHNSELFQLLESVIKKCSLSKAELGIDDYFLDQNLVLGLILYLVCQEEHICFFQIKHYLDQEINTNNEDCKKIANAITSISPTSISVRSVQNLINKIVHTHQSRKEFFSSIQEIEQKLINICDEILQHLTPLGLLDEELIKSITTNYEEIKAKIQPMFAQTNFAGFRNTTLQMIGDIQKHIESLKLIPIAENNNINASKAAIKSTLLECENLIQNLQNCSAPMDETDAWKDVLIHRFNFLELIKYSKNSNPAVQDKLSQVNDTPMNFLKDTVVWKELVKQIEHFNQVKSADHTLLSLISTENNQWVREVIDIFASPLFSAIDQILPFFALNTKEESDAKTRLSVLKILTIIRFMIYRIPEVVVLFFFFRERILSNYLQPASERMRFYQLTLESTLKACSTNKQMSLSATDAIELFLRTIDELIESSTKDAACKLLRKNLRDYVKIMFGSERSKKQQGDVSYLLKYFETASDKIEKIMRRIINEGYCSRSQKKAITDLLHSLEEPTDPDKNNEFKKRKEDLNNFLLYYTQTTYSNNDPQSSIFDNLKKTAYVVLSEKPEQIEGKMLELILTCTDQGDTMSQLITLLSNKGDKDYSEILQLCTQIGFEEKCANDLWLEYTEELRLATIVPGPSSSLASILSSLLKSKMPSEDSVYKFTDPTSLPVTSLSTPNSYSMELALQGDYKPHITIQEWIESYGIYLIYSTIVYANLTKEALDNFSRILAWFIDRDKIEIGKEVVAENFNAWFNSWLRPSTQKYIEEYLDLLKQDPASKKVCEFIHYSFFSLIMTPVSNENHRKIIKALTDNVFPNFLDTYIFRKPQNIPRGNVLYYSMLFERSLAYVIDFFTDHTTEITRDKHPPKTKYPLNTIPEFINKAIDAIRDIFGKLESFSTEPLEELGVTDKVKMEFLSMGLIQALEPTKPGLNFIQKYLRFFFDHEGKAVANFLKANRGYHRWLIYKIKNYAMSLFNNEQLTNKLIREVDQILINEVDLNEVIKYLKGQLNNEEIKFSPTDKYPTLFIFLLMLRKTPWFEFCKFLQQIERPNLFHQCNLDRIVASYKDNSESKPLDVASVHVISQIIGHRVDILRTERLILGLSSLSLAGLTVLTIVKSNNQSIIIQLLQASEKPIDLDHDNILEQVINKVNESEELKKLPFLEAVRKASSNENQGPLVQIFHCVFLLHQLTSEEKRIIVDIIQNSCPSFLEQAITAEKLFTLWLQQRHVNQAVLELQKYRETIKEALSINLTENIKRYAAVIGFDNLGSFLNKNISDIKKTTAGLLKTIGVQSPLIDSAISTFAIFLEQNKDIDSKLQEQIQKLAPKDLLQLMHHIDIGEWPEDFTKIAALIVKLGKIAEKDILNSTNNLKNTQLELNATLQTDWQDSLKSALASLSHILARHANSYTSKDEIHANDLLKQLQNTLSMNQDNWLGYLKAFTKFGYLLIKYANKNPSVTKTDLAKKIIKDRFNADLVGKGSEIELSKAVLYCWSSKSLELNPLLELEYLTDTKIPELNEGDIKRLAEEIEKPVKYNIDQIIDSLTLAVNSNPLGKLPSETLSFLEVLQTPNLTMPTEEAEKLINLVSTTSKLLNQGNIEKGLASLGAVIAYLYQNKEKICISLLNDVQLNKINLAFSQIDSARLSFSELVKRLAKITSSTIGAIATEAQTAKIETAPKLHELELSVHQTALVTNKEKLPVHVYPIGTQHMIQTLEENGVNVVVNLLELQSFKKGVEQKGFKFNRKNPLSIAVNTLIDGAQTLSDLLKNIISAEENRMFSYEKIKTILSKMEIERATNDGVLDLGLSTLETGVFWHNNLLEDFITRNEALKEADYEEITRIIKSELRTIEDTDIVKFRPDKDSHLDTNEAKMLRALLLRKLTVNKIQAVKESDIEDLMKTGGILRWTRLDENIQAFKQKSKSYGVKYLDDSSIAVVISRYESFLEQLNYEGHVSKQVGEILSKLRDIERKLLNEYDSQGALEVCKKLKSEILPVQFEYNPRIILKSEGNSIRQEEIFGSTIYKRDQFTTCLPIAIDSFLFIAILSGDKLQLISVSKNNPYYIIRILAEAMNADESIIHKYINYIMATHLLPLLDVKEILHMVKDNPVSLAKLASVKFGPIQIGPHFNESIKLACLIEDILRILSMRNPNLPPQIVQMIAILAVNDQNPEITVFKSKEYQANHPMQTCLERLKGSSKITKYKFTETGAKREITLHINQDIAEIRLHGKTVKIDAKFEDIGTLHILQDCLDEIAKTFSASEFSCAVDALKSVKIPLHTKAEQVSLFPQDLFNGIYNGQSTIMPCSVKIGEEVIKIIITAMPDNSTKVSLTTGNIQHIPGLGEFEVSDSSVEIFEQTNTSKNTRAAKPIMEAVIQIFALLLLVTCVICIAVFMINLWLTYISTYSEDLSMLYDKF